MIRIERVRLPAGMRAFARRENGVVVVQVSADLPAGERLAAVRAALRAARDAGWRSVRHPVLLPALAGGAGLRRAPQGRWTYRALLTAAVAVAAAGMVALTIMHGARGERPGAAPPAGAPAPGPQPGGQLSPGPDQASRTGRARSSGPPPAAPGRPAKRTVGPGAPVPQVSGTPVPVPTPGGGPSPRPSPRPSAPTTPGSSPGPWPSPAPDPSPRPSPSPSGSGGSPGTCVDVLGIIICL